MVEALRLALSASGQWIARMTDEQLEALKRPDLANHSFDEASNKLLAIRTMLEALIVEDPEQLAAGQLSGIPGQLQQLDSLIAQIREFSAQSVNAEDTRRSLTDQLEGLRDWFAQVVRPQLRTEGIDALSRSADIEVARQTATQSAAEIESLLGKIRGAAGVVAAGSLSGHYAKQAKADRKQARWYVFGLVVSLIVVGALGLYLFAFNPPEASASGDRWQTFGRQAFVRVFLLALATYVTAFVARGFRTARHLQVTNEQKQNALNTYPLFASAAPTAEAQTIITAELVRAVFGSGETGYLNSPGEKTIIETTPSLLGLLRST